MRRAVQLGRVLGASTASSSAALSRRFSSRSVVNTWGETEEEQMIRESVAAFAKEEIAPHVQQMDEEMTMKPDLIKRLFEQGLMGIEVDVAHGGSGMKFSSACAAIEELAKVDASVSVCVDVQNTLVNIGIRKWGSKQLQDKWLPRLATDTLGSFCLSEWGSGSDAFALKTSAEKKGDEFVLNGSKAWITNSAEAGLFIVFANADFSAGYKGITAFLVPRDTPGLTVGKKEDKLGIRASSTCEVLLQDVVVPKESIVGELGKGYKIAIESLNEGRIGIGAQMLGIAEGAFDLVIPYIKERKQFGQPIANFQGMQFEVSRMATRIAAAKLLVFNAARLCEAGQPFVREAAIAKLVASEVAQEVSSLAVDMMGGMGFVKESGVEKFYRDSKIGTIYEGTSNVQKQTIGKDLLSKWE